MSHLPLSKSSSTISSLYLSPSNNKKLERINSLSSMNMNSNISPNKISNSNVSSNNISNNGFNNGLNVSNSISNNLSNNGGNNISNNGGNINNNNNGISLNISSSIINNKSSNNLKIYETEDIKYKTTYYNSCCNKIFSLIEFCIDTIMTLFGPILAIAAIILILLVVYSFFIHVIPKYNSYQFIIILIGLILIFNILFNYFCCMFKSPGYVPSHLSTDILDKQFHDLDLASGNKFAYRICGKCNNNPKPMRSHHCSICKKCVLKMDHHCPWISYRNHRYFILFLFYLMTGCLFYVTVAASTFFEQFSNAKQIMPATFLFSYLLAAGIFIAMIGFLGWNSFLLVFNISTIEFYNYFDAPSKQTKYNAYKQQGYNPPMDFGIMANIRQVFGDGPIYSFFLPRLSTPPGVDNLTQNGLVYPMRFIKKSDMVKTKIDSNVNSSNIEETIPLKHEV